MLSTYVMLKLYYDLGCRCCTKNTKDVFRLRLSMWILADWLADLNPVVKIQDGKRTLRNARLYANGLHMERSTVYIGNAGDFFDNAQVKIICANEHDLMFVDADDIDDVLNRILDAFDYYNSWSDHIKEMVKTECSLNDVLADSMTVLQRMVAVADASYYVYAKAGLDRYIQDDPDVISLLKENMMTLDSILEINQDQRIRVFNPLTYILEFSTSANQVAVRNIFFRGQHKGWLITVRKPPLYTRGELDLQDELGDVVEQWLEYHQSQRELLEKSGIFLEILESKVDKNEDVYRRIESLGWNRDDALQVYVFRDEADYAALHFSLDHKLEQLGVGIAVHFEGNLLFILNTSRSQMPEFSYAFGKLLEKVGTVCGRSPVFTNIFDLTINYEMAVIAADYSPDRTRRVLDIESAALSYYFSLIHKNDKAGLVHPALRILNAYDRKHRTQLCLTLETFLRYERNYIHTSQALHLHRNSLLYRVERIIALTGIDLESCSIRLHLMMSFEIERMNLSQTDSYNKSQAGEAESSKQSITPS